MRGFLDTWGIPVAKLFDFGVQWGIFEEQKCDFRVKWGIFQEKMRDVGVKRGGLLMRKRAIFGLNSNF